MKETLIPYGGLRYDEIVTVAQANLSVPFTTRAETDRVVLSTDEGVDLVATLAAVDAARSNRDLRGGVLSQDAQGLMKMSAAELDAWLNANITTLAQAKDVLKRVAQLIRVVLLYLNGN